MCLFGLIKRRFFSKWIINNLCNLKASKLNKIDIEELRTMLYNVKEENITEEIYQKILFNLEKEGVKDKFYIFLHDYKIELHRKEKAIEYRKKHSIFLKNETLETNWLEKGTLVINVMCVETYPCHHSYFIEYIDEKGITKVRNFSSYSGGGGGTILDMLKNYSSARWNDDEQVYDISDSRHPIHHFKKYEK